MGLHQKHCSVFSLVEALTLTVVCGYRPEKRFEDYTELDDTPKKILPRDSSYSNLRVKRSRAALLTSNLA